MSIGGLPNHLRVLRKLGEGGFARVYLVQDKRTRHQYALKLIPRGASHEESLLVRKEFRLLSRLNHPAIVGVTEYGSLKGGEPYLVMEYVDGPDVKQAFSAPLRQKTLNKLLLTFAGFARALDHVHRAGSLHLDLKPSNLMLTSAGQPKLMDFGLATRRSEEMLAPGGTIEYLAPELIAGKRPDARADLYSLGVVLYEILSGDPPFTGTPSEVARQHLAEIPRALSRLLRKERGSKISELVLKLLQKEPGRRIPSAARLAAELEKLTGVKAPQEETFISPVIPSLVGRARVLKQLKQAVVSDGGRFVIVEGERGMGKSRLLEELHLGRRSGEGHSFLLSSSNGGAPLATFRSIVEDLLAREFLVKSIPAGMLHQLRRFVETRTTFRTRLPFGQAKVSLFSDAIGCLQNLPGGVIFLIDDVHRIDTGSAEFLSMLLSSSGIRSSFILALRPEELGDNPSALRLIDAARGNETALVIKLQPLSDREIADVASSMLGVQRLPQDFLSWLRTNSDGLPYLIEEAVRSLCEAGRVTLSEGMLRLKSGWRSFKPTRRGKRIAIFRLRELSRDELEVVRISSVLGPALNLDNLRRVARMDTNRLLDAVQRLQKLDVLVEDRRSDGTRYAFKDNMMAQAIYEDTSVAERAGFHLAVGQLLEKLPTRTKALRASELAGHFVNGERGEKAVEYSLLAAQQARVGFGPQECVFHLTNALRFVPKRSIRPRIGLMFELAEALESTGSYSEALKSYRSSLRDLERLKSGTAELPSKTELHIRIAGVLEKQGNFASALKVLNSGQRLRGSRAAERATVLNDMGWLYYRKGDFEKATDLARRALRLAEKARDRGQMAQSNSTLGVVNWILGRWEDSVAFHRKCLVVRRSLKDELGASRSHNNLGLVFRSAGKLAKAREEFLRSLKIKEKHRDVAGRAVCLFNIGLLDFDMGQFGEALRNLFNALEIAERIGDSLIKVESLGAIGECFVRTGEFERAGEFLGKANELARKIGSRSEVLATRRRQAELFLCTDEIEQARTACAESLSLSSELGSEPGEALGRRVLARILLAAGKVDEAKREARRSLNIFRSLNKTLEAGRTLVLLGEAASQVGEREKAMEYTEECIREFSGLGAQYDLSLAKRLKGKIDMLSEGEPIERLARDDRALVTLYRISRIVNSILNLDELLDAIMDLAINAVGAERGLIILRGDKDALEVRVARDVDKATIEDARRISKSVVRTVSASGEPVVSIDVASDPRFKDRKSVLRYKIRSLVCVPLRIKGGVVGTIYLDNLKKRTPFSKGDVDFLLAFANQAALAIENARLYESTLSAKEDLEKENQLLRDKVKKGTRFENLVGDSPTMKAVFEMIEKVRDTNSTVLVRGESGTGKECVAQAIHFTGSKAKLPFVAINCASIPERLLESELFGHEKGAFTDAVQTKIGSFEAAGSGTIFLDEIGDMNVAVQAKILRVLQEKEFCRLGSSAPIQCRARVIASTNRQLEKAVEAGTFRKDLYYRLNVIPIPVPALRRKKEDIPLLVHFFIEKHSKEYGKHFKSISSKAMDLMMRYSWPGNVRELENCIKRCVVLSEGPVLLPEDLPEEVRGRKKTLRVETDEIEEAIQRIVEAGEYSPDDPLLKRIESLLVKKMVQHIGEKKRAAQLLGISKPTLYEKLKEK